MKKQRQNSPRLKRYLRHSLLMIIFIGLFFVLIFFIIQNQARRANEQQVIKKQTVGTATQKITKVLPVRLLIPKINVDTNIQYVGVAANGEMEVPNNAVDAGWFNIGPRPGEKGSAVLAGHLDGERGEAGVFTNLNKLKPGDKLYIENNDGTTITFIVRESRIYKPGYAENVFTASDIAHLNLITCDGVWDGTKKSYSKRLVVFTDIMS